MRCFIFKHREAEPKGGSNQANVASFALIVSSCEQSQKRPLRRTGDHVAAGRLVLRSKTTAAPQGGRRTADSRKCLEDGCKHLVCTRSRVKKYPSLAQEPLDTSDPAEVLRRDVAQQRCLPTCIGFLPLIRVRCLLVGRHRT